MSRFSISFAAPAPVLLTQSPGLVLQFPSPVALELRVQGLQGVPGRGLPPGGTTWQVPRKASATDYDVVWGDAVAAADWASITGKPAAFPPSAHPHVATDITDFDAAIAVSPVVAALPTITVSTTAPLSPAIGDLWVDTN